VNDRLWHTDEVYDLPDDFPIYEKNFKSLEAKIVEPEPVFAEEATSQVETTITPEPIEEKITKPKIKRKKRK